RRGFAQGMRSEAIGYAAGPGSGIAAGEDINAGIAYDQGLLRLGLHLSQDGLCTLGIRLLGGKAVATVPGKKTSPTPTPRQWRVTGAPACWRARPSCEAARCANSA